VLIATSDEEVLVGAEGKSEDWFRQFVLAHFFLLFPFPDEETFIILVPERNQVLGVRRKLQSFHSKFVAFQKL
jgi:hypothetical protein